MTLPFNLPYGGAVFFSGSSDLLKAGFGAILSGIIKDVTHAPWSHCGYLCWQRDVLMLFESTEWQHVSGPQWNVFSERLHEYSNGGLVVIIPYRKETAPDPTNLENVTAQLVAMQRAGQCKYGRTDLVADLIDYTLMHRFLRWAAKKLLRNYNLVCSACLRLVTDPTASIETVK